MQELSFQGKVFQSTGKAISGKAISSFYLFKIQGLSFQGKVFQNTGEVFLGYKVLGTEEKNKKRSNVR